ncbi:MAG TPA: hypothetical protein VG994_14065 [Steroidobacteraceae bacterium]|nr:hypothetical protein [Steroidobacteraceae bacterium]
MEKSVVALVALGLLLGEAAAQAQQTPPPAPQAQPRPTCTRESLQAAVDSYLAAQKSGDRTKMALAESPKFLENMNEVAADAGTWNTALPIAFSRSFLDKDRCRTFSEVIVTEGPHQYVIGTRLSVDKGKITAIDSLVSDKGDWLFNANAYLKYSSKEDWSAPKKGARASMQELINAANSYLDLFSDKLVKTPWGRPCARLEGGAYTNRKRDPNASCEVGIPPGVLYIVNRDYVVDEEQSVINVFCRFGNSSTGMPDSHTFRLVNGKITNVHTISVNLSPDRVVPQADDDGAILR